MACNDGTGIVPSVTQELSGPLVDWLVARTGAASVIDLGTGVGWLVAACEDKFVRCLGVDGSAWCVQAKKCKSDILQQDITDPIFEPGRFDLAVSFECIEHIPLASQEAFFRAASRCSDRLICSIHVANGENGEHSLIRSPEWWTRWLDAHSVGVTPVSDCPLPFNLSVILDLDVRYFSAAKYDGN